MYNLWCDNLQQFNYEKQIFCRRFGTREHWKNEEFVYPSSNTYFDTNSDYIGTGFGHFKW